MCFDYIPLLLNKRLILLFSPKPNNKIELNLIQVYKMTSIIWKCIIILHTRTNILTIIVPIYNKGLYTKLQILKKCQFLELAIILSRAREAGSPLKAAVQTPTR